jgi:EAL domain-containing protein (putative c-di-GMP-specific phosphodiesterase class I)
MVRGIVEEARVSPRQIVLEVTESALVDADLAAAALCELKAIGVEIAIDDFGTGYSSLSRLKRFPVDYLKIDQSFVAGMTRSSEDAVIVAAVLGLAETLGLRTVAEGIEEETQLRELAAHGCQMGQGFLWSPALPPEEAARWAAATSPFPHAAVSLKPHVTVAGNAVRNASNKLAHELATPITALVG